MAFKASPKRLGVLGFWASWIFFNVRMVGELASKGHELAASGQLWYGRSGRGWQQQWI